MLAFICRVIRCEVREGLCQFTKLISHRYAPLPFWQLLPDSFGDCFYRIGHALVFQSGIFFGGMPISPVLRPHAQDSKFMVVDTDAYLIVISAWLASRAAFWTRTQAIKCFDLC